MDEDDDNGLQEPLSPTVAKALIRQILENGDVVYTRHALEEMAKDPLGAISKIDVVNVLRGGVVGAAEMRIGTYRYPVSTRRFCVVVAFRASTVVVIVTSWREKP